MCPTSCPLEINSFPSFNGPKGWRSKTAQKLSWANRYCESVHFIETTTCQCRQLKLNPLSTQINIYCVMTNQTPRTPLTRAAVMLRHFPYFPCLPPPTTLNPDACLLGTYATKMVVLTGKCSILRILRKNKELEAVYFISKSSVNLQALINNLFFSYFTIHTICTDF